MDYEFLEVKNKAEIIKLADTAKEIWLEYYPEIISVKQVEYMIDKYQSADAVAKQILCEGYRYFLLLCNKKALGYMAFKKDGDRLFISKLYLKKEFRGKGIFSAMLLFIEETAKKQKLKSLYLTVNRHNKQSITIYRKKGFVVSGEQITDIGGGYVMDDYVMEKTL